MGKQIKTVKIEDVEEGEIIDEPSSQTTHFLDGKDMLAEDPSKKISQYSKPIIPTTTSHFLDGNTLLYGEAIEDQEKMLEERYKEYYCDTDSVFINRTI